MTPPENSIQGAYAPMTQVEGPLETDCLQVDVASCIVTNTQPIVSPAKSQKCLLQLKSNLFP